MKTPSLPTPFFKSRAEGGMLSERGYSQAQLLAFAEAYHAANPPVLYGYAFEQPDGHSSFHKERPTGLMSKKWTDLRCIVHELLVVPGQVTPIELDFIAADFPGQRERERNLMRRNLEKEAT